MPRITYNEYHDRRFVLRRLLRKHPAFTACISHERHVQLDDYFALSLSLTDAGVYDYWLSIRRTQPKLAPKANKTFFYLFDLFEDLYQVTKGDHDQIRRMLAVLGAHQPDRRRKPMPGSDQLRITPIRKAHPDIPMLASALQLAVKEQQAKKHQRAEEAA